MSYAIFDQVAYASRLYQAGLETELSALIEQVQSNQIEADYLPWLRQLLMQYEENKEQLPISVLKRTAGWQAYMRYDYLQAYTLFQQCLEQQNWQKFAYDAALGMAKIYTRSGHWQSAKEWSLYYLYLARRQRDDYGLVKGYGALAELFLRADKAMPALAIFLLAKQMMPAGQGQLDRHYNFIASALMRNGQFVRAEALLRNSMKLTLEKFAEDKAAQISYLHSQSRLCFLQLVRKIPIEITPKTQEIIAYPTHAAWLSIPLGFIHAALAIEAIEQAPQTALVQLEQALTYFKSTAPMEAQWIAQMLIELKKNLAEEIVIPTEISLQYQKLSKIEPQSTPEYEAVVDKTWQRFTLPNNGYNSLQNKSDLTHIIQLWRLFFI